MNNDTVKKVGIAGIIVLAGLLLLFFARALSPADSQRVAACDAASVVSQLSKFFNMAKDAFAQGAGDNKVLADFQQHITNVHQLRYDPTNNARECSADISYTGLAHDPSKDMGAPIYNMVVRKILSAPQICTGTVKYRVLPTDQGPPDVEYIQCL